MPREIEKNDVDITQLFKWSKETVIRDPYSGVTVSVYLRLVGDADMNRAKAQAYRKSAELRKKLKTPDSDERTIFLTELDTYVEKESIIQAIILLEMPEYYQQAIRVVDVKEPKEPKSFASQEEQEEFQSSVDKYPAKFSKALEKELQRIREVREEELNKFEREKLYGLYENTVINRLCEEELKEHYYKNCVFFGSYKDANFKVKAFKTFDEFENSHQQLQNTLRDEYIGLELGTDLLKKLQGATE